MCNFFSFILDKKGRPHYFEAKQQIKGIVDPHSHSSITSFYGINDDAVWKYEVDPETTKLTYDGGLPETEMKSSIEKSLQRFMKKVPAIIQEWKTEQAIVQKEIDTIVDEINKIEWFSKKKKPLKSWKVFKNRAAARTAVWDAARIAAAAGAARAGAAAAGAAAVAAAWDAAWDAQAKIVKLKGKHAKHLCDRMDVWKRGYGLLCDVNGVLYVYEQF